MNKKMRMIKKMMKLWRIYQRKKNHNFKKIKNSLKISTNNKDLKIIKKSLNLINNQNNKIILIEINNSTKVDLIKVDLIKVDQIKEGSIKVDLIKVGSTKVDSTKEDSTKVGSTKEDSIKVDSTKVIKNSRNNKEFIYLDMIFVF